jgi:cyclophilin family peptidyl-prolyl cis-trans isomerase/HEAT repeat protein
MKKIFYSLLALVLLVACSDDDAKELSCEERVAKLQKIAEWQDIKNSDSIEAIFEDQSFVDDTVEARAMIALGNLRDSAENKLIIKYFHASNPKVRRNAVTAAGLIGSHSFFKKLRSEVQCEEDTTVIPAYFEAIGRSQHQEAIIFFEKAELEKPEHHKGLALGLFRLMERKIFTEKALSLLEKTKNIDAKRILSIYLLRAQQREKVGTVERVSALITNEKDAVTKANLCALLHAFPGKEDFLKDIFDKNKDERVRVNVLRAMATKDWQQTKPTLMKALKDTSLHVQAMAAEVISALFADANELEKMADSVRSLQAKSHFWKAIIKTDMGLFFSKKLQKIADTTQNRTLKGLYTEALGNQPDNAPYLFNVMKKDSGFVRTSSVYALAAMHFTGMMTYSKPETKKVIIEMVKYALSTGDDALVGVAGGQILTNPSFGYMELFKADTQFLRDAMKKIALPKSIETYQILANALALFEGKKAEIIKPEYNNPIDFNVLRAIGNEPTLVLKTEKGIIKTRLFPQTAPGTVAYIAKLAQSGFYDGKIFHRVIPNFVSQGGCPRGDGMGGTELTLRTEIGLERFEEGSIGMASSGPDTESCQFFFTHLPAPHLDGRYTVFGKITEGFDVMMQLEIGSRIESAMIENGVIKKCPDKKENK